MKRAIALMAFLVTGSAFAIYTSSPRLLIDGKLASSNLIERDGIVYVPAKDVAAALGKSLVKTASGYEIGTGGGANQIEGISGPIGKVLWNGVGRFEVIKMIRGKTYTNQFASSHEKVSPYPAEDDLIVLVCRIKNGTTQSWMCGLPGGSDTALTDTNEHSYSTDNRSLDAPSNGVKLLPGTAVDFALTFDVPSTEKPKDLVYELTFYGNMAAGAKKFRVSLGQGS